MKPTKYKTFEYVKESTKEGRKMFHEALKKMEFEDKPIPDIQQHSRYWTALEQLVVDYAFYEAVHANEPEDGWTSDTDSVEAVIQEAIKRAKEMVDVQ